MLSLSIPLWGSWCRSRSLHRILLDNLSSAMSLPWPLCWAAQMPTLQSKALSPYFPSFLLSFHRVRSVLCCKVFPIITLFFSLYKYLNCFGNLVCEPCIYIISTPLSFPSNSSQVLQLPLELMTYFLNYCCTFMQYIYISYWVRLVLLLCMCLELTS